VFANQSAVFKSKTAIALSLILASTGFAAADGVFGGSVP